LLAGFATICSSSLAGNLYLLFFEVVFLVVVLTAVVLTAVVFLAGFFVVALGE
jgi:hypothetical protein